VWLPQATWRTWVNDGRPAFIPYYPHLRYENKGFISMEDFLGESAVRYRLEKEEQALRNPDYWDYNTARAYVRTLNLESKVDFLRWCRMENMRPTRLPVSVRHVYRHHGTWVDWSDFLFVPKGQDPLADPHMPSQEEQAGLAPPSQLRPARSKHMTFEDSRYLVRLAGLTTVDAYESWWKAGHCPSGIPFRPDVTYDFSGWLGWDDWLGMEPGTVPHHEVRRRALHAAPCFACSLCAQRWRLRMFLRVLSRARCGVATADDRTPEAEGKATCGLLG